MKVVHYVPFIDKTLGGVSAFIELLARDLGKLCDLYILTHKSDNDYQLESCRVIYMPPISFPLSTYKKEFVRILKEINPDIFHANGCWRLLRAYSIIWAKELGIKTVLTPHGMLDPYAMKHNYWTKKLPAILLFQRKAVQEADCIHCTADIERTNVLNLGWNQNIEIIPNCVQVDNIKMKNSWKRTNKLVFISRIHHKKGIHFLIDAVADIASELAGYQILIAGPKEDFYYDEMKQRCKKLGVSDIIQFLGPVYGDEKWKLYQESDVFVLPTITENFGIVVAEALACGTPVITTKGAPWEDINTYHCGWWVEVGKAPLKEALHSYINSSSEELEVMGKNGHRLIVNKYSSLAVAHQFIEMYKDL